MAIELYNPEFQQFSEQQIQTLNQPLQEKRVKEREGATGKLLKYLKTDDVIGVANEIFGYGRWGYKVIARDHQMIDDPKKGPQHIYTADIELSVVGCPFTFPGDGVGIVNKPFTVEIHEKARKEATSDALKRALRHYGDQFGLCLYNEDDMVEGADGNMKPVKEAKQQKPGQAPKRVVDTVLKASKEQVYATYDTAKALELFASEEGKAQQNVTNFLQFLSEITGTPITALTEIMVSHLETADAYMAQTAAS